jgi:protein involved in polysaccharide export with SLBB domain
MRASAALLVSVLVASTSSTAPAQSATRHGQTEGFATRAELESLATNAERAGSDASLSMEQRSYQRALAASLYRRVREGDFQPGDRIAIALDGPLKFHDTVVVRSRSAIQLPELPEISLAGVLRSELQDYLLREVKHYVRDPELETSPLMRLTVSGAVLHPGFYSIPADALLSDLVMAAGGPTTNAAFTRSHLRRGTEELPGENVQAALRDGLTVDALLLRSGDELLVGEKRQFSWPLVTQVAAAAAGLASVFIFARR